MPHDEAPDQRYLSGDALKPYQVPFDGNCWWCGATADSREHKFKRTDLTRMWDDEDGLMWGSRGPRLTRVRSPRSQVAKFAANLCQRCNNERSQPFDVAYDKFAEYVWNNTDLLWRSRYLDMEVIYGRDRPTGVVDLARYVAKHLGCRMSTDGYAVPASVIAFLDGSPLMPDVQMCLFKERERRRIERRLRREDIDGRGLWIGPAAGYVSKSRQVLTLYSSTLIIAHVGVMYRWEEAPECVDPFYLYRRARLHMRPCGFAASTC
jgi:hypothetical protein